MVRGGGGGIHVLLLPQYDVSGNLLQHSVQSSTFCRDGENPPAPALAAVTG